jgi:hypothetical protein
MGAKQAGQVKIALNFLGLLTDAEHLGPKVHQWRSCPESLPERLVRCFRDSYASAGCDRQVSELIGNPGLPKVSIRRLLEHERPFQAIKTEGTRDNSIRFVCAFHDRTVKGTIGRNDAEEPESVEASPWPMPPGSKPKPADAKGNGSGALPPPTLAEPSEGGTNYDVRLDVENDGRMILQLRVPAGNPEGLVTVLQKLLDEAHRRGLRGDAR